MTFNTLYWFVPQELLQWHQIFDVFADRYVHKLHVIFDCPRQFECIKISAVFLSDENVDVVVEPWRQCKWALRSMSQLQLRHLFRLTLSGMNSFLFTIHRPPMKQQRFEFSRWRFVFWVTKPTWKSFSEYRLTD